ncbi:MAG: fasciclin domain-containing protein [Chloroflexota bacterium]|nr:fasciclin domain-containing protein [Chloroflexota bacterium]
MKFRLLSVAAVLLVAMLAIVPSFAQDMEPTIAEIVVASTEGDAPEFTTLLAAVAAADPAILELLSNPDAGVTVFAPTDAAFAAALEALGLSAEELLADTETLNSVLMNHVVPAELNAEAIVALNGAYIGTALHESALLVTADDMGVMVNESTVVTADVLASNGVVHIIDAVLVPDMAMMAEMMDGMMEMEAPTQNIAEIVIASTEADAPEFATLLAAVLAADPAILATLTASGPYTVFAPTDAAFAAALEALGLTAEELLADTELLTTVLAYHVVPGHFSAATIVAVTSMDAEGALIATALPGTFVTVTLDGESVLVNGTTVVATDVYATNGIVHVIDGVLLPPME